MAEEQGGVERLVFFSDAVVAIAITLLALPLAEVQRDDRTGSALHPLAEQLALDVQPLVGAALSFFVIARLWWAHHQLFARVTRFSRILVVADVVWLFTVVALSAATALVPEYQTVGDATHRGEPVVVLVYVGTMTVSAVALTALAAIIHLDPALSPESRGQTGRRLIGLAFTAATFAVAGTIGFLLPVVNYWALLLLLPSGWLEELVKRRMLRRYAAQDGARAA